MSAGLTYKYFGGKEDLLLATIVRILDVFRDQLALKHWHFGRSTPSTDTSDCKPATCSTR